MPAERKVEERFTDRVENYIRYRPSYPSGIVDLLESEAQPAKAGARLKVADIGSGTGIFTTLLLDRDHWVSAVEPNPAMREAAERLLSTRPNFTSHPGTAENTDLRTGAYDLIVAAQAYHWFDPSATRDEFFRILRPGGIVALIWNERREDSSPFLRDYEQLLKTFGTDYSQVKHQTITPEMIRAFFEPSTFQLETFDNFQTFDLSGIKGRLLSSSYVPNEGDPAAEPMLARLREIFSQSQVNGRIQVDYDTRVYFGELGEK